MAIPSLERASVDERNGSITTPFYTKRYDLVALAIFGRESAGELNREPVSAAHASFVQPSEHVVPVGP